MILLPTFLMSDVPIARSSRPRCMLMAGWLMPSFRAAPVRLLVSITASAALSVANDNPSCLCTFIPRTSRPFFRFAHLLVHAFHAHSSEQLLFEMQLSGTRDPRKPPPVSTSDNPPRHAGQLPAWSCNPCARFRRQPACRWRLQDLRETHSTGPCPHPGLKM